MSAAKKTTPAKRTPRKSTAKRSATKQSATPPSAAPRSATRPSRSSEGTFSEAEVDSAAAPLDALLVDAAIGQTRRFLPDASTLKLMADLAKHPRRTATHLGALGGETVKIVFGTSQVAPDKRDRRFADSGWSENPILRRLAQSYLATSRTAEHLVKDADLDWRDAERTEFLLTNLIEALSPSNIPLVNPASAKEAIDTAGMSLVRGGTQLLKDMADSPRIPEMVDTSKFEVGRNIAVTPGAVVFRNEVLELIQYTPQSEFVREVPVLVVPPTINKFYAIDLAEGRSLVEHSVRHERQIFVISWRNPDARHAAWNFDTYVESILEALSAVEDISGSEQTVLAGICAGGILASMTAAYLAAIGEQDRLRAFCLAVTVLDTHHAGAPSALVDRGSAEAAKAMSAQKGYLDGRTLAEVFAWLRPGDLVWNYWVNNYLMGRRPPAFDILFWNSDTTRMPAGLHADFINSALENKLVHSGALTVLGEPIDLGMIEQDTYVIAGIADHITPWQSCYRTTQLFGGDVTFVLSTSGHIAALVNPPGNPKSTYRTNATNPPDAADWLAQAEVNQGTWWNHLSNWLDERGGELIPAPAELGNHDHQVLAEAPGTYVYDS